MNVTDHIQQYLKDRPLSRVEIGECRSLSLGFGENNTGTFFMSHLRDYKEVELGTYSSNWRVKIDSLTLNGDNASLSEGSFRAFLGEFSSVSILEKSINLSFPRGQIEFFSKNDGDEDFHLFTPSRDCWEWKNNLWKLH